MADNPAPITRRDFLNGIPIAVGGAVAAGLSPEYIAAAFAAAPAPQDATGYYPPAFSLKLAHKDVSLANALGRELGVPMRLCNLTLAEMTEAMGRGWGGRDSRVVMKLAQERAGVDIAVDAERMREALAVKDK